MRRVYRLQRIHNHGIIENLTGETRSASEGVVGQSELENRPLLRPGDVLESIPNLIMTQHSGSGKSNQMFLRGFNLDHGTDFATWVDGISSGRIGISRFKSWTRQLKSTGYCTA